jgi:hypothetical protein
VHATGACAAGISARNAGMAFMGVQLVQQVCHRLAQQQAVAVIAHLRQSVVGAATTALVHPAAAAAAVTVPVCHATPRHAAPRHGRSAAQQRGLWLRPPNGGGSALRHTKLHRLRAHSRTPRV